jgi:hypothetical protein
MSREPVPPTESSESSFPTPRAQIVVASGPGPLLGRTFDVGSEVVTIGSDPGCTICLSSSPDVAPHHARIWLRDGRHMLHHVAPDQVTAVEGEPVVWASLTGDEEITIGPWILLYIIKQSAELPDPNVLPLHPPAAGTPPYTNGTGAAHAAVPPPAHPDAGASVPPLEPARVPPISHAAAIRARRVAERALQGIAVVAIGVRRRGRQAGSWLRHSAARTWWQRGGTSGGAPIATGAAVQSHSPTPGGATLQTPSVPGQSSWSLARSTRNAMLLICVVAPALVVLTLASLDLWLTLGNRLEDAPLPELAGVDFTPCLQMGQSDKDRCIAEAAAARAVRLTAAARARALADGGRCDPAVADQTALCAPDLAHRHQAAEVGGSVVQIAIELVVGCREIDDPLWSCVTLAVSDLTTDRREASAIATAAEALTVACASQREDEGFRRCISAQAPVILRVVAENLVARAADPGPGPS